MDPRSQYAEVPSAGEVTVSLDNGSVPTDVNTLPHADHMTNAPVPPTEQPTLEGDFYHKPMEHLERIGLAFKIHAAVGLGVTLLCFFSTSHRSPVNIFFRDSYSNCRLLRPLLSCIPMPISLKYDIKSVFGSFGHVWFGHTQKAPQHSVCLFCLRLLFLFNPNVSISLFRLHFTLTRIPQSLFSAVSF